MPIVLNVISRFVIGKAILAYALMTLAPNLLEDLYDRISSLINMFCRSYVLPSVEIENAEFFVKKESVDTKDLSSEKKLEFFKVSIDRRYDSPLVGTKSKYRLMFFYDGFSLVDLRLFAKIFGLHIADDRPMANLPKALPTDLVELLESGSYIIFPGTDITSEYVIHHESVPAFEISETETDSEDAKTAIGFLIEPLDVSEDMPSESYVVFHDNTNFERFTKIRDKIYLLVSKVKSFVPKFI